MLPILWAVMPSGLRRRVPHFSRALCARSGDFDFLVPSLHPGNSGTHSTLPKPIRPLFARNDSSQLRSTAQISTAHWPILVTAALALHRSTAHNDLAIVVSAEPERQYKFFEIKILMFKSPVSRILHGTTRIEIQQHHAMNILRRLIDKNCRGVYGD